MKSFLRKHKFPVILLAALVATLGVVFLLSYLPRTFTSNAERLSNEVTSFPYPKNFKITEVKKVIATEGFCIDQCSRTVVYGIFKKPTSNKEAFKLFVNNMKQNGYQFDDAGKPSYSLSLESVDSPHDKNTLIDLQVWPEPAVIPGGGDNPSVPVPESPTQWVEVSFE